MKLRELKDKIISGEIKVNFGKLWMDMSDPMSYLIEEIDQYIEWSIILSLRDKPEYLEKRESDEICFNKYNMMYANSYTTYMKLHSWVVGEDCIMRLENNILDFVEVEYGVDLFDGIQSVRPYNLADDLEEPNSYTITVPSKRLNFINYYPKEINKQPIYLLGKNYSMLGRKNITKFYAEENNIGYGQMGNMSISIYGNGKRILITEHSLDEIYDEDDDYSEEDKEYNKNCSELLQYIANEEMIYYGYISLAMWRYECGDSELYGNEDIVVPIDGTTVSAKHYYQTLAEHPMNPLIYAEFLVN